MTTAGFLFLMQTLIHALFQLDLQVLFINHSVLSMQQSLLPLKDMRETRTITCQIKKTESFKNGNIYKAIITFYNQTDCGIGVLVMNLTMRDYNW